MNVLLHTHVWVWWLTPEARLRAAERAALDAMAARRELRLSAISMWEAQVLHAKGRLSLPLAFSDWLVRETADDVSACCRSISMWCSRSMSCLLRFTAIPRTA